MKTKHSGSCCWLVMLIWRAELPCVGFPSAKAIVPVESSKVGGADRLYSAARMASGYWSPSVSGRAESVANVTAYVTTGGRSLCTGADLFERRWSRSEHQEPTERPLEFGHFGIWVY